MKSAIILFRLALISSLTLSASHAASVIYVNDPFTDGGASNGADAQDIAWYVNNSTNASSSVENDTVINTGNALKMTTATTTATFRKFIGVIGSTISILQGETLQLSFEYRYHAAANLGNGLRFGLFNTGTNSASGDNLPSDNDNFGYAGVTNPGLDSATGTRVAYEAAFDAVLGGTAPGALVSFGPSGASVNSGTTSKGSVLFSITRNLDDSIFLSTSINGQAAASGTLVSPASGSEFLNYEFNEVAIGNGGTSANFSIDNVLIQVIPEPSAALLGGLGALLLMRRRR